MPFLTPKNEILDDCVLSGITILIFLNVRYEHDNKLFMDGNVLMNLFSQYSLCTLILLEYQLALRQIMQNTVDSPAWGIISKYKPKP